MGYIQLLQSGHKFPQIQAAQEEESDEDDEQVPTGKYQKFFRADKQKLKNALGDISKCDAKTKAALSNIYTYWKDIDQPRQSDWLHTYPKDGFGCYDKFGGKMVSMTKNVLYIQPLVFKRNTLLTDTLKRNLKKWLEA